MIDPIQNLHQFVAMGTGLIFIKQIQLRHAAGREIIQHYASLCISMTIEPDTVQGLYRGADNVPGVSGRQE